MDIKKVKLLSEMYHHVTNGGKLQYKYGNSWENVTHELPTISSNLDYWRKEPIPKIVDLSVLIKSKIDCEFWDYLSSDYRRFSRLRSINSEGKYRYTLPDTQASRYTYCTPRMNHVHAWLGAKECPLPEGFKVQIHRRDRKTLIGESTTFNWAHDGAFLDIIYFEVLGLSEGYKYPWE